MTDSWQNLYSCLTDFVSRHNEIQIKPDFIKIPNEIRPEFYIHFDKVRRAFIEQTLPKCLEDSLILTGEVTRAEKKAAEKLGLTRVQYPVLLERFLHDPLDAFMREAFDPLFDLLLGRIDLDGFAQNVPQRIADFYSERCSQSHEKWLTLSLIYMLGASELFQFKQPEIVLADAHRAQEIVMEEVPIPILSKELQFYDQPESAFTLPDYIVYVPEIKKYVAVRSGANNALATAFDTSGKRKWLDIETVSQTSYGMRLSDVTLIYIADNADDIALIADKKKFCRPDIIVECKIYSPQLAEDLLEDITSHYTALQPRIAAFLVLPTAMETLDRSSKAVFDNYVLLTPSFDNNKLALIVEAIAASETENVMYKMPGVSSG